MGEGNGNVPGRQRREGPDIEYWFGEKIRRQIRDRGWGDPDEYDLSALEEVIASPRKD